MLGRSSKLTKVWHVGHVGTWKKDDWLSVMIIKDCKVYDADTTDRAVILQSFSSLRERLYSTSAPSQAVMFGAVRQYFLVTFSKVTLCYIKRGLYFADPFVFFINMRFNCFLVIGTIFCYLWNLKNVN